MSVKSENLDSVLLLLTSGSQPRQCLNVVISSNEVVLSWISTLRSKKKSPPDVCPLTQVVLSVWNDELNQNVKDVKCISD